MTYKNITNYFKISATNWNCLSLTLQENIGEKPNGLKYTKSRNDKSNRHNGVYFLRRTDKNRWSRKYRL